MTISINSGELKRALNVVAGFVSKSERRLVLKLSNVINEDNNIFLIATDSYKAIKYKLNCEGFKDVTSFNIDPQFILKMLKIYGVGDYQLITLHSGEADKIYIDIDNKINNIPLPPVKGEYPTINLFNSEEEKDLDICFDINNLIDTLKQLKKANAQRVKVLKTDKGAYKLKCNSYNDINTIVMGCRWD